MHENNIPTFVLRRLRALEQSVKRFTAAAVEAEREAERLRILANTQRTPKETEAAQKAFFDALAHAKEVRSLANVEKLVHDGCEALIKEADNRCKIEDAATDPAGRDLAAVNAQLAELDKQIHAITVAYVPPSRAEIEAYVAEVGAAFERGVDMRSVGGRLQTRWSTDFFNELVPDWWRQLCAVQPEVAIAWAVKLNERRAAQVLPVDQRSAALEKLNAEKLSLQHIASALIDAVRADAAALQVMRDPATPPAATLQVKIRLPSTERAAA
jgi:hypothetical protein